MRHHTDGGRRATHSTVKIALDGCIINLWFHTIARGHHQLPQSLLSEGVYSHHQSIVP